MPGTWTPEPFVADNGAVPFERFIEDLPDLKFAALDAAIEGVLSVRGIELVRTEWLRALGKGVHEFRIRHSAAEIARMFGACTPRSQRLPTRSRCASSSTSTATRSPSCSADTTRGPIPAAASSAWKSPARVRDWTTS